MRNSITTTVLSRDGRLALRAGFSLVELLVAAALSLLVMAAVTALLGDFGRSVSDGRAIVDLNSRMRNVAWRLRQDLTGLTCGPAALVRAEENAGYFHVIEGPLTGAGTVPPPAAPAPYDAGDVDDILAFTTSSPSAPFVGRLEGAKGFESPTAEVIWFCVYTGVNYKTYKLYNLHRRQLLVSATPEAGVFANNIFAPNAPPVVGDPRPSDISYSGTQVNSLGDLSTTANRFLATAGVNPKLTGTREGEDVLLGNVIAFDVRLIDSAAAAVTDQSFETRVDGNPATAPMRGIDVRIRSIEPTTGQIRELKVVHSFGAR